MRAKVIISDKGKEFLKKGQIWMYQNNLEEIVGEYRDGDIVDIETRDHEYLGSGFINSQSHIIVRILSKNRNDIFDKEFFKQRIKFAYDYRKTVESSNLDNVRIIYGEADLLPGLIVDRYNDILVTQISILGLEIRKDMIYECLLEVMSNENINGIYERNDLKIREKEGLTQYKGFYKNIHHETELIIHENGLKLKVDIENGQKTGYFLDQKSNRLLIRNIAHDKAVLDCFTHTGGFALNAAIGNARHVTAVDVSQVALDEGYKNACLNHIEERMTFTRADVFDYLDTIKKGEFDIIILDPPAFTKSRRTVNNAYNGYKRINKQAMKVLERGGYLATCSCSRYMENELFEQMIKESALEAGVTLRQISVTQQNHDHPILWTMGETSYLKFYLFQII